jgi:hypothetical protein
MSFPKHRVAMETSIAISHAFKQTSPQDLFIPFKQPNKI